MTYKLPSGLASFETTGGFLPTEEWTLPGRAADRNKALREALKECHRLQSAVDDLRHGIEDFQDCGFPELLQQALNRSAKP